jgi:hypothetical protein
MIKEPVLCNHTRKKLANIDSDGVYLWCKTCKTEHRFSRETIIHMWQSLEESQETIPSISEKRMLY